MPSRLSGYIENLFLLRNINTYTLHIYNTKKIYRIHLPHRPIETVLTFSHLQVPSAYHRMANTAHTVSQQERGVDLYGEYSLKF